MVRAVFVDAAGADAAAAPMALLVMSTNPITGEPSYQSLNYRRPAGRAVTKESTITLARHSWQPIYQSSVEARLRRLGSHCNASYLLNQLDCAPQDKERILSALETRNELQFRERVSICANEFHLRENFHGRLQPASISYANFLKYCPPVQGRPNESPVWTAVRHILASQPGCKALAFIVDDPETPKSWKLEVAAALHTHQSMDLAINNIIATHNDLKAAMNCLFKQESSRSSKIIPKDLAEFECWVMTHHNFWAVLSLLKHNIRRKNGLLKPFFTQPFVPSNNAVADRLRQHEISWNRKPSLQTRYHLHELIMRDSEHIPWATAREILESLQEEGLAELNHRVNALIESFDDTKVPKCWKDELAAGIWANTDKLSTVHVAYTIHRKLKNYVNTLFALVPQQPPDSDPFASSKNFWGAFGYLAREVDGGSDEIYSLKEAWGRLNDHTQTEFLGTFWTS